MPNWRKVVVADSAASFGSVATPNNVVNDFTASYAINASTTAINSGTVIAISPASDTWILNHSVNERFPIVTCWESGSNEIVQPDTVRSLDINTVEVKFTTPVEGFANVSRAGHVISGSQGVTLWTQLAGPANITASGLYGGFTGSLQGTASYAISAPNAESASYASTASFVATASNSISSSYSVTSSYAENSSNTISSSYSATASLAIGSISSSYAVSSSYALFASNALSSSFASTASYWSGSIQNATSASVAISSSWALSSSNAATASYWSGSIQNATSASYAVTASYWSGSIQNVESASFAMSASNALTASYAATALTASNALTASYWSGSIQNATSASVAITASYALTASRVELAQTASHVATSSHAIRTATASYADSFVVANNLTVNGTASFSYIQNTYQTASIIYTSGSTKFGDTFDDVMSVTGSIQVSGSIIGTLTGTASWAQNSVTASYWSGSIQNALSSSFATTASYWSGSIQNALSSSYSISSSFATSASFARTASNADYATSASYALNGGVTQLLAGPNITISPTSGKGQVTISSTGTGGPFFNTATGSYGSFYDTTTQTNPVGNIPRSMSLNTTDITNGVSISGSSSPFNTYIKIQNPGVYNIQFSAQLDKTDGGSDEIIIWLRKNGINLTDTATSVTLNGNNDKQVAAWNWFVNGAANDYYQIIWQSADTNVRIYAEAADGTPGIPSVIATVNRVDQFLSNTGSFTGEFTGAFTGSLFGTASNAITASYALASLTASYAVSALSASHLSTTASNALTSSYSNVARTASYSDTASFVNVLKQAVIVSGSVNASSGYIATGSYNLLASTGQNLYFNSNGQIGSSGTGPHITISPSSNITSFSQVVNINNSVSITPGANLTTLGLNATVGFYPSATIARFSSGSVTALAISGSGMIGTGSFNYQGRITATTFTGSLLGTASFASTASYWSGSINNATSASYAVSASYAPSTPAFPYTGSAQITGSLSITGSVVITGSLTMQDVIVAPYLSIANYSSDAEAAAAGIPLWGIYRSGNMLVVRLT